MAFTSSIPSRSRPDRVKPPRPPSPVSNTPGPPSWAAKTKSAPPSDEASSDDEDTFHDARFPPDEEAALVAESNSIKTDANRQFAAGSYSQAISTYDRALASCPNYLDFEIAVLQSNIAACHIKLEEWKEAIESADRALDALDREDPPPKSKKDKKKEEGEGKKSAPTKEEKDKMSHDGKTPKLADLDSDSASDTDSEPAHPSNSNPVGGTPETVVELPSDSDSENGESTAAALKRLNLSDERHAAITRIRTKALLRRARARSSLGLAPKQQQATAASPLSPSSLSAAGAPVPPKKPSSSSLTSPDSKYVILSASLADYTTLSSPPYFATLPPSDARTVLAALRSLPPQVEEAKNAETAEMMGKLKELGNGILRPFGLSTENFKMIKDEKTGGYSLSFEQGNKK